MPAPTETLEQELKLHAERDFRLPSLPGEPLPERVFTSTYYDTPSRRLAGAGVTLRRRVEKGKGLWQLKLPRGANRLELELPGGPAGPPPEMRELLTPYLRGAPLEAAAKLRTRREGVRVHELDGAVADVTIDAVTVLDGRRTARAFQELEVELLSGNGKALNRIGKVLRAAGATQGDGRPKLFQALDLEAPAAIAPPAPEAPPSEHLKAMFRTQYLAIVAHDPGTRLGTDPEELHQMRVATRRLRAFLRAARPLLDLEWAESLRSELAWLGGVLGPVRDLDVLSERLLEDAAGLDPVEQRALRRFLRLLDSEREHHRAELLEAMRSERYLQLLARLENAAVEPRLTGEEIPLGEIAATQFKRLRKAVRALPAEPSDAALHDIRIRGKRARYAAELAESSAGKRATRFIEEAKAFQDVLGEHQDSVVAEERLRSALRRIGGKTFAFTAGRLIEREETRRQVARAAFPEVWKRLEKRGREAWA
jgi:CHAD domain-containing protein